MPLVHCPRSRNWEMQEKHCYGYIHSAHWFYTGVVIMTFGPHYPSKDSPCPLSGRLGEPQGPSRHFGRQTNHLTPAVLRTPDRPTRNLVAIPITPSRLPIITKLNFFISLLNLRFLTTCFESMFRYEGLRVFVTTEICDSMSGANGNWSSFEIVRNSQKFCTRNSHWNSGANTRAP